MSTREVTEVDKVKFASKLAVKLVAGSFNRGRASLLVDPGNNSVSSASTSVILFLAIYEPEEGWESLDLEAFSEGIVFGGIDLGKVAGWVLVSEDSGSSGIFRGKLFAVSAPWSVKLNKQVFVF